MQLGFISEYSEISKYYFHSISNNIGLDIHDVRDRDVVFKSGMV